ncbi:MULTISPECIES: 4-hydroxy-tetrahydrodipicolinate synthase [unclassified Thermoactinomyces]|jgi:4-hydroxy-tetrahydrodipicolinate synthase|uniref:4-hydroxy-tetrahydrodipicolinate synthase n=1 Tax=unclassified Thermoactinomyces TaxID=2634588 RepID=UPI0007A015BB|nr:MULTISPECIES: 4-hydroxy-tetrahydrodipicolinate synthase [unclassified Thermoactinomyces]KYQ85931.1 4-hydroxy-tetrahydrodipicolinate synthase [Thermoactinomyces sp. AS95]MBI0388212.1 4-hydroxy-tetrahydrodipicolinate synthase [Thermoactinomyces sp. CICC 24227]
MLFGRLITALFTPFTEKNEIDWPCLEANIERLIEDGNDSIVVSGTTGESPTLTLSEKLELYRFAKEKANGRIKVIAGTGSNNTLQSLELTKKAEEIGVDGVMLVAPYYNKPSQEGLYQHFKTIAESTSLPVMLYNVPGRTSVNMTAETMTRLAQLDNVVAIKEASGDLNQIGRLISAVPGDVAVYSGDDGLTLPILSIGGAGVVSVASHLVSREMKEMMEAFFSGDVKKAQSLHIRLLPVFHGVFLTTSPAPLKYAMSQKGWSKPYVRLPIVELSEEEKRKTDEWLKEL